MDCEHEIVVYDDEWSNNRVKIFVCELWLIMKGNEILKAWERRSHAAFATRHGLE